MKKIYVAPAIEVMTLNNVSLCQASVALKNDDEITDLGGARSREHSLWDPFEEDED